MYEAQVPTFITSPLALHWMLITIFKGLRNFNDTEKLLNIAFTYDIKSINI